ncbi:MAG: glucose 1-dehydrogenase [Beijerinckiaceae bacterium]
MSLFDLKGRVAIVTGGNGGIGLGMARGLAEAGAAIIVFGRNADKNARAVQELEALGARSAAIAGDIRKEADCEKLIAESVERFGRLDILVNNAGINYRRPPESYSRPEWRDVIETNLTSAFVCSQAAYPHFLKAGGGKIINIGSMTSIFGLPFAVAYASSKGGIVQMTKALASAWAKDNIQANAILPGWIDTDLTKQGRRDIPGLNEKVLARTPAGRWGVPADFAGIAVFLAGAASDFINGATITVDGGYSANG